MPNRFKLSAIADADLADIWDYVARKSYDTQVADNVVAEILSQISWTAENPHTGHRREDLTNRGFRFVKAYEYLIVYEFDEAQLSVVAIIAPGQDVARILRRLP